MADFPRSSVSVVRARRRRDAAAMALARSTEELRSIVQPDLCMLVDCRWTALRQPSAPHVEVFSAALDACIAAGASRIQVVGHLRILRRLGYQHEAWPRPVTLHDEQDRAALEFTAHAPVRVALGVTGRTLPSHWDPHFVVLDGFGRLAWCLFGSRPGLIVAGRQAVEVEQARVVLYRKPRLGRSSGRAGFDVFDERQAQTPGYWNAESRSHRADPKATEVWLRPPHGHLHSQTSR